VAENDERPGYRAGDLTAGLFPTMVGTTVARGPRGNVGVSVRFGFDHGTFGPNHFLLPDEAEQLGRDLVAAARRARTYSAEKN
jgi:hypothetical protein